MTLNNDALRDAHDMNDVHDTHGEQKNTRSNLQMGVDLSVSRARIDEIDAKIIDLFCERMEAVKDVAAYKQATGKPVFDAAREAEKIAAATEKVPDIYKEYIPPLFTMLMELSRSYQDANLHPENPLKAQLADIATDIVFPDNARVAIQGEEGSWSHLAARQCIQTPDESFYATWDEVCEAVLFETVDFGILPLENSTTGTVNRVWDLLATRGLYIVKSLNLTINQDLLAPAGTQVSDIVEVLSHEQALRQCEGFLEGMNHAMKRTICENTAAAAKRVAESGRKDVAAIASAHAAQEYGLEVLAQSIQDQKDNFTRFVLIAKRPTAYKQASTSAFQLVIPHEPGALFRVLSRFASIGVNMTKLESRPIPGKPFEFMFFVDVECVPGTKMFDTLLAQVPPLCDEMSYIGTYIDLGFVEV